jgi:release factor glutamine methyltransferase
VVSNPPYISDDALQGLQPELRYEPRLALAGGPDGLTFHRRLIMEAAPLLSPGGLLAMEVGQHQASSVHSLLEATTWYDAPRTARDAAGIERVVSATRRVGE